VEPVLFALGCLLLGAVGVLVPAALGIRRKPEFLLTAMVAAMATVVVTFHALSVNDWLYPGGILACQALVAATVFVAWRLRGAPGPPRGWRNTVDLRDELRRRPAVAVAVSAAALALIVQLVIGLLVAPNNWDAMAYHLSRAAYWLQFHSAGSFEAGSARQLGAPPNGEMLQAWTMALAGPDRFTQLVQWVALAGLVVAVFAGARLLGFSRCEGALAASLFATLPLPIMQAASAQNDLIGAFLVAAAAVLMVRGTRDRSPAELGVAIMAIALAVGTKRVALLALVPLGILLLAVLPRGRRPMRALALAALGLVAVTLPLGLLNYVSDLGATRQVLEPGAIHVRKVGELPGNAARVLWSFVDFPGMSVPLVEPAIEESIQAVAGGLEIPGDRSARDDPVAARGFQLEVDKRVSEDGSAYGPLGLFVLLPLLVVVAFRRGSPPAQRVVAAAALAYFLVAATVVAYHPWAGRQLLAGVAIGAPLLALVARRQWLLWTAVGMAVVTLVPALMFNERKPLVPRDGQRFVLGLDRVEQQTLPRREMRTVLSELGRRVPPDASIGFVGGEGSWDYPYFGDHPRREVMRSTPVTFFLDMERERLAGVVVNTSAHVILPTAVPLARDYLFVPPQ
jgi:hypothetical protein